MDDYRITIVLDREINKRLDMHLEWGMKSSMIRKTIELLADFMDKHGRVAIALILDDKMELRAKETPGVKDRGPREDSRQDEPRRVTHPRPRHPSGSNDE